MRRLFVLCIALAALFSVAPLDAQTCAYPTNLVSPVFCYTTAGPGMNRACFANLRYGTMTTAPPIAAAAVTTFPPYRGCMTTSSSNVTSCTYVMAQRRLHVQRPNTGTTMAFCQVICDCGVLTIDESDGLPVELMEFSVDPGDD